jgi:hypothetical protein
MHCRAVAPYYQYNFKYLTFALCKLFLLYPHGAISARATNSNRVCADPGSIFISGACMGGFAFIRSRTVTGEKSQKGYRAEVEWAAESDSYRQPAGSVDPTRMVMMNALRSPRWYPPTATRDRAPSRMRCSIHEKHLLVGRQT